MFHRSCRPVLRAHVAQLVQHYEQVTERNSSDSSTSSALNLYVVDAVPEDPLDTDDYMIPHIGSVDPIVPPTPDAPRGPRNRRSLPRMNYTAPAIVIPTSDTPLPDLWDSEVSPLTRYSVWPTPAELRIEEEKRRQAHEKATNFSRFQQARNFAKRSAGVLRKIAGKHRPHFHRRPSTPHSRGSQDTFVLRTPKRQLELQPSVKSRAKRVARGAVHSLVHLPEASVDAMVNLPETTQQAGKTLRKRASRTHMLVVERVGDAKEKVSTSISIIRPPRSRYTPLVTNATTSPDVKPLIQDTYTTPSPGPWSLPDAMDVDEPWPAGIIPPPPSPSHPRQRHRLQKRLPQSPRYHSHNQIPASYTNGQPTTAVERTESIPAEHIFTQALVSDVEWQALDSLHPMIIITDDNDRTEGSWYLPLNSAGQVQIQYASASHSPPTPLNSPRSSIESHTRPTLPKTKKWYNGRLSFGSARSISATVGELRERESSDLERMLVGYTDETPLMVEFLSKEKSVAVSVKGRRKAVLWAPVGSVLL